MHINLQLFLEKKKEKPDSQMFDVIYRNVLFYIIYISEFGNRNSQGDSDPLSRPAPVLLMPLWPFEGPEGGIGAPLGKI